MDVPIRMYERLGSVRLPVGGTVGDLVNALHADATSPAHRLPATALKACRLPDGAEVDLRRTVAPLGPPPELGYSVAFSLDEARLAWVRVALPDSETERMCLSWTDATATDVSWWLRGRFGCDEGFAAFSPDGSGRWRRLDLADGDASLLGRGVLEHRALLVFREA